MRTHSRILWSRLFRRCAAFFLATLAVWALLAGTGWGLAAGSLDALTSSPLFVSAALQAELGNVETGTTMDELDFWQRLVGEQSALLRQGAGIDDTDPLAAQPTPSAAPAPSATPPLEEEEPPAVTAAPGDIVERTLVPTSTDGYAYADGLYLYNRTNLSVDLAAAASAPIKAQLPQQGPQILIIHTHATEAYTPDGSDVYTPSDQNSRTLDENYNMIRVGNEMERVFTEMGLSVLHDKGVYDYPAYNGAYSRSGAAIQKYLAQYPSIQLVLDVHRDALVGSDNTVYKAVTKVDGVKTAQVMLVLGSGSTHPNWMENLALAARIQRSMDTLYPTLARPMTLRSSVYNQNLTPGSLLVEVGTHGNTLQEALNGARCFARAAGQVFLNLTPSGS